MQTINQIFIGEFEAKKSKFIAHLCPFGDFENTLKALKIAHLKAAHFVWAFRYLNEKSQIIEDKSDDGEPKGSSAAPCLNVLRGKGLINVALVVVRYFGGTKLGVGGLLRAYTSALNAALQNATLFEFELKEGVNFSLNIKNYTKFEHFLKKEKIEFKTQFLGEMVKISANLNEKQKINLMEFGLANFKEFAF